jgi:hypothetical protein
LHETKIIPPANISGIIFARCSKKEERKTVSEIL